MLPPGLAFVGVSDKAWKFADAAKSPKFYFNFKKERESLAKNQTSFTSPVSLIIGLNECLRLLQAEGLDNAFRRHARLAHATREAVKAIGLEMYTKESPSNSVTAISAPKDIDGQEIYKNLRVKYGITAAGGQGQAKGKIFRIAHLGHTIENGLVTYKGLPAPIICDYLSRDDSRKIYETGTEFQRGKIEMVANTGTYIDCTFHRFEHGKDLSEVELACFTDLVGIVIRVPYTTSPEITDKHLRNYEIRNRAVSIHTGWDVHWNTEHYYENHPYLTEAAAVYLRDCGVKLVGIDSHNIDNTNGKSRPVHTTLLGAEILFVEHLCNLQLLPEDGFTFSAQFEAFCTVGASVAQGIPLHVSVRDADGQQLK